MSFESIYASKRIPQLELFSVVVHKHSRRPLNLYGSICVDASYPPQSIYKREREDPECLPSNSKCYPLLLDGPPELISFCESYAFLVDLKHRVQDSDASFDEEVCKGTVYENYEGGLPVKYNELLNCRLDGKDCSVEFRYGLYKNAARAHVTATLINLKMKDIKIYGQIASQTRLILNGSKDIFNKKSKDGMIVNEHDGSVVLQLPRSVVAAPLDSELTVSANLYACPDDKVRILLVSGTANFFVKEFGMSVGVISGNGCDLQVEVDWLYF